MTPLTPPNPDSRANGIAKAAQERAYNRVGRLRDPNTPSGPEFKLASLTRWSVVGKRGSGYVVTLVASPWAEGLDIPDSPTNIYACTCSASRHGSYCYHIGAVELYRLFNPIS